MPTPNALDLATQAIEKINARLVEMAAEIAALEKARREVVAAVGQVSMFLTMQAKD